MCPKDVHRDIAVGRAFILVGAKHAGRAYEGGIALKGFIIICIATGYRHSARTDIDRGIAFGGVRFRA